MVGLSCCRRRTHGSIPLASKESPSFFRATKELLSLEMPKGGAAAEEVKEHDVEDTGRRGDRHPSTIVVVMRSR
jgi:hypothetical protein